MITVLGWMLLGTSGAEAQNRGARPDDSGFAADDKAVVPPKLRLWYTNATFARLNPLGLVNNAKLGLRIRMSDKTSLLWKDTYAFVGASAIVTPAWARVGGYAEVQPIALLRVFTEVNAAGYFGTFNQILTFDDPAARYSDQTIDAEGDRSQGRLGWTATIGATVRAKAGPIAVRNTAQVQRIDLALPSQGLFFYDQLSDRLAKDGGWILINDLDLLFVKNRVRTGLRHTMTNVLDERPADADGSGSQHRFGPLFAYQVKNGTHSKKVNQSTLFVMAQWWLKHPYRTGEEQSAGLPLIAFGYAFNGDLKTW